MTLDEFKDRTNMPVEFIEAIEAVRAGWTEKQIALAIAWIESRLRKRYAVPFDAPQPEAFLAWVTRLVTFEAWQRRGYDPADLSMAQAAEDAKTARDEVKEAADSKDGLFDLPLRADTTAQGIRKGGPLVYSEQSPYVWTTRQGCRGRFEDDNDDGTYGP